MRVCGGGGVVVHSVAFGARRRRLTRTLYAYSAGGAGGGGVALCGVDLFSSSGANTRSLPPLHFTLNNIWRRGRTVAALELCVEGGGGPNAGAFEMHATFPHSFIHSHARIYTVG